MSATRTCPICGATVEDDVLDGRCPRCVAKIALGTKVRYFGDYELLEEIGRGGMGVVFKARQVSLNRHVAVKMLLHGDFASEEFVKRFQMEAEAAASLQHPNIVAIHEIGVHEGRHYFSMDLVEGRSLAELARNGPLANEQAARYVRTMAEAIQCAHQGGVVHRDLKPSNVLIDGLDQPRITDFGLAKRFEALPSSDPLGIRVPADSLRAGPFEGGTTLQQPGGRPANDLTLSGQILGAPSYMPPEQATGKRGEIGVASDIYALGAILYHLLTGRPPFLADSLSETLQQVQTQEPTPPRLLNASVPRDLETICLKCLRKNARDRYESAAALAEDLRRWQASEPILARPMSRPEKVWRLARKHPVLATVCGAVGILALAAIITLIRQHQQRFILPPNVAELIVLSGIIGLSPEICLSDPQGTFWHKLPAEGSDADVSPDAARLCYMHQDTPKTASVWVSRIDGTARKRVLPNARRPRWVDDHTLIYEPPDLRSVWELDLHTGRTRKLFDWSVVTTNGYAGSLELSPDRKHILTNPQKGHWGPTANVFVCDLDGRNVRSVWEDPDWPHRTNGTTDTCLVWLAGDRFAWCRHARMGNRVPDMAIVTCCLGERNFQALTPWVGYNFPLAGSPDGRRILFLTEDVPGGGNLELWTMNVDGTDRRKVLERKFGCDSGITARWVRRPS